MRMIRFEVGFVSADRSLVDFYAEVFELGELPAEEHGPGTLYRLQSPGAVVKVMVPTVPPEPADRSESFLAAAGLRYLSIWVSDLDAAIARATTRGGRVLHGPMEIDGGRRIVLLEDPDGNTIEVVQDPSRRLSTGRADRASGTGGG